LGLEWTLSDGGTLHQLDTFLRRQTNGHHPQTFDRRASSWTAFGLSGRLRRRVSTLLIVGVGIVIGLRLLWLQRDNVQMSREIYARNLVISQLEQREQHFERNLDTATEQLSKTLGEVEQLDRQTSRFEGEMRRLMHEVGRFQLAYSTVREERNQLVQRIAALEQEQGQMLRQSTPLPMLHQVVQEMIDSRTYQP
jgi:hypothetical protein